MNVVTGLGNQFYGRWSAAVSVHYRHLVAELWLCDLCYACAMHIRDKSGKDDTAHVFTCYGVSQSCAHVQTPPHVRKLQ